MLHFLKTWWRPSPVLTPSSPSDSAEVEALKEEEKRLRGELARQSHLLQKRTEVSSRSRARVEEMLQEMRGRVNDEWEEELGLGDDPWLKPGEDLPHGT